MYESHAQRGMPWYTRRAAPSCVVPFWVVGRRQVQVRILYLVPDLFTASGGISRYCRLVVKALTESAHVDRLEILALQDRPGTHPDAFYFHDGQHNYQGFGGDRIAFSRAVAARMLTRRYTCVLSGHAYLSPLPFLFGHLRGSMRLVTFVYGLDATSRLPWFRRVPLARSQCIVAITSFTADLMTKANGVPSDHVRVLHNCLDPVFSDGNDGAINQQTALPRFAANSILTVSRLSRADAYKGHASVLRAMPSVIKEVPDAVYYIVGEGELRCELERQVDALGLGQSVVFLGRVSDADLARCYRMARAFVMPSKAEGFGFVFLEAMAHGRPVVAGNRDAAPEVLGNGEAGLLVDPDDVPQIAAALSRLLLNPDFGDQLGTAGRARAKNLFGYPLFRRRLEEYLCEVDTGCVGS